VFFPRLPAVYAIRCTVNGRAYVGRTRDLRARMGHHWTELARGVHYNRLLQADWDTYGAGAFSVEVLERHGPLCSTRLGEARWIAHFAAHGQDGCYNVTRPASPL
jgi:group I intron endonuclease